MRVLEAAEAVAIVILMVAIFFVVLAQIVWRYILESPLTWTEEVAQLCLVFLVFIVSARVMSQRRHITVRLMDVWLGSSGRWALEIFALGVVIVGSVVFVIAGLGTTVDRMELSLPATGWPAGLPLVASLIGFALMAIHAAVNLWSLVRGGVSAWIEDTDQATV